MRTSTLVIDMTYKTLLSRVTSVYMRDQELGREINWHANHYTFGNPSRKEPGRDLVAISSQSDIQEP